jgi:ornithine cyclodeaminase
VSVPFVPFEAEARLDWIGLSDALADGHALPRADLGDTFLRRGADTLLSRAAWIDGMGALVKTASVFPGNAARGLPTINGGVALYSDTDGTLEAMVDFHLVTKWKTAADSLLAARRLAPETVRGILVVGAGRVAASMIAAYSAAFPQARIAVWNRTRDRAERLAGEMQVAIAPDLEQGVRTADIVCCATMSQTPILKGAWLRPGQHVDLIGAFRADMREADDTALSRARLFVDSRATTLEHIGELKEPIARGVIAPEDVVADFYELERFRRAAEDITLFKNGGGAHLDLMTARHILSRWEAAEG